VTSEVRSQSGQVTGSSKLRGCSSVGRAVALQAIGQEFDPPQLHHFGFTLFRERGWESGRKMRRFERESYSSQETDPKQACSSVG